MKAVPDEMRFRFRKRARWIIVAAIAFVIVGVPMVFVTWQSSENMSIEKFTHFLMIRGLIVASGTGLTVGGLVMLYISIPLYMGKIPPGIRLRKPSGQDA